jgi:hypothetical protein
VAAALFIASPVALALYVVAYLLFVLAARFADAFHHTFELMVVDNYAHAYGPPAGFDRAYEDANTFSNLLSRRWPLLNLLVLNFSYHNAHHVKPGIPWHRLPALDATLFGRNSPQCISIPTGRRGTSARSPSPSSPSKEITIWFRPAPIPHGAKRLAALGRRRVGSEATCAGQWHSAEEHSSRWRCSPCCRSLRSPPRRAAMRRVTRRQLPRPAPPSGSNATAPAPPRAAITCAAPRA